MDRSSTRRRIHKRDFYGDESPREFLYWAKHMGQYFGQFDYIPCVMFDKTYSCLQSRALRGFQRVEDRYYQTGRDDIRTFGELLYCMTRHYAPDHDAYEITNWVWGIINDERETRRQADRPVLSRVPLE